MRKVLVKVYVKPSGTIVEGFGHYIAFDGLVEFDDPNYSKVINEWVYQQYCMSLKTPEEIDYMGKRVRHHPHSVVWIYYED